MCKFYGWTPDYVMEMDIEQFQTFFMCTKVLEKNSFMRDVNIADMPHLKNTERNKIVKPMIREVEQLTAKEMHPSEFVKKAKKING